MRADKTEIPDLREDFASNTDHFVSTGIAPIYGWRSQIFDFYRCNLDPPGGDLRIASETPTMRSVTIDGLLNDRVARLGTQTVSRGDALKFICYHAFGVHFAGDEKPVFNAIRQFRYVLSTTRQPDGTPQILIQDLGSGRPSGLMMDFAHAHVFSTGYYLVTAPDVLSLERLIEAEHASPEVRGG